MQRRETFVLRLVQTAAEGTGEAHLSLHLRSATSGEEETFVTIASLAEFLRDWNAPHPDGTSPPDDFLKDSLTDNPSDE